MVQLLQISLSLGVQSCPTLCDPMDLSGSSVHGIFLAGILEWVPFPSLGDLPNPGIKSVSPVSPALQENSLSTEPSGKQFVQCMAKATTKL